MGGSSSSSKTRFTRVAGEISSKPAFDVFDECDFLSKMKEIKR